MRSLLFVGAFVIVLGVALFVYRFAPALLHDRGLHVIIPTITCVLVGGGTTVYAIVTRGHRLRVATRIVAALATIATATAVIYLVVPWNDRVALERRQLPGFSIDLPVGRPTVEQIEYATGQVQFAKLGDGESSIILGWGRLQPDDQLEAALRGAAKLGEWGTTPTEIAMPSPDGVSARTMGIGVDAKRMRMSQLSCENRSFFVLSLGPAWIESLHRRVLRSFVCTPDPTKEQTFEPVRVSIDLPSWTALETMSRARTLTDGRAVLILAEGLPRDVPPKQLAVIAPIMFGAWGTVIAGAPKPDRVPFTVTIDGAPNVGWLRAIHCGTHTVTIGAFVPTEEEAQALFARTSTARCLRAGELAPDWAPEPTE